MLDRGCVVQPGDRFAVVVLRACIVGDECSRSSEEASSERCVALLGAGGVLGDGLVRKISRARSGCGLDQIGEVGGREERIVAVSWCWRSTALLRSGRVRARARPSLGRRRRASSRGGAGGRRLRPRPPRARVPASSPFQAKVRSRPMSLGLPEDVAELVTFDEVRPRRSEFSGSELVQCAEGEGKRQGDDRSVSASGRLEPRRDAPERLIVTERSSRPAAHPEPSQHRLVVAMIGLQCDERLRQPLLSCRLVALDDCDVSVQEQIADRWSHAGRERATRGLRKRRPTCARQGGSGRQECGPRRGRRAACPAPLECRTVHTSSLRPARARPCRRPRRSCSGCCLRGGWLSPAGGDP